MENDRSIDTEKQFRIPENLLSSFNSERDFRDFLSFFINASVPLSDETLQAKARVFPIYKPLQTSLLGITTIDVFNKLGGINFKEPVNAKDKPIKKLLIDPLFTEREYIIKALLPIIDTYARIHNMIDTETDLS